VAKKISKARVLSSKVLFRGRVFGVRRDHVIEPGGIEAVRELVTHPGSVVVLPVFPDGRILLIRQYRHATGRYLWELVAGRKDPGESFVRAAHRELAEETGYTAQRMTKLMDIFPSPGFVSERMEVFLAEGLIKGTARPENDEKIRTQVFTLAALNRHIRWARIRDAKSVASILFYERFVLPVKHQRTRPDFTARKRSSLTDLSGPTT
jgi:ADP-ribose pyrophosphatase